MKKAKRPPREQAAESLEREDWDFSDVPNRELIACCYWEYARESEFIRNTLQSYREWWLAGGPQDRRRDALFRDMDKIQSIGDASNVIVQGCSFRRGTIWQSGDPKSANYRHKEAPPITGSFPDPWQSLSRDERKYRGRIRHEVAQFQIVPIKLSHWSLAKDIARHGQALADDQQNKRMVWEGEFLRRAEKGNSSTLPGAPDVPEFAEIRPGLRWGFYEAVLVDIAWEQFTNDEIATYFRSWVKHARPEELKAPSNRGHKPGDWRSHLTRLAVMRLLSRFKASQIIDPRRTETRPVSDSRQFAGRKWLDPAKWHDARREAGRFFGQLFPFLPEGEKPRSWNRRLSRK